MIEKSWSGKPVDPAWAEVEIARLTQAVDKFSAVMKSRLAQKVLEGRRGWDDPGNAEAIYTALLAQAASTRLAAGHEADIANFAMFLYRFRTGVS